MPDFSKYSNYNEKTSFSGVTFGANSPVLEVELNEAQQIEDTKFKRLTDIIGDCVHPMSNGDVSFNEATKVLTLTNCVVIAHGFSAFISSATVTLSATNKFAYAKLEEKTANGGTALKEYGNTSGAPTSNPMVDSRIGVETTRRRFIAVTLIAGASVPNNTDTVCYAPIGELVGSEFIPEFAIDSLVDLGFSVNEDGEMCVTYEDEED